MKVNAVNCRCAGKDIDIAEVVCPSWQDDGDMDQEVRSDYANILHGRNSDWILCEFHVTMTGICLKYYNAKRDVSRIYPSTSLAETQKQNFIWSLACHMLTAERTVSIGSIISLLLAPTENNNIRIIGLCLTQ